MRKEAIIAILFGIGVGLTAALLILFLPQRISNLDISSFFSNKNNGAQIKIDSDQKDKKTNDIAKLIVTEPENRILVKTSSIKIKGEVLPNTQVIILSTFDQAATVSNNKKKFEAKLKLKKGKNDIQIVAYPKGKEKEVVELKIYYMDKI